MGTESRIGIAFGFLIVAAASIYFIYGADRSDGDLLLTKDEGSTKTVETAKSGADKSATKPVNVVKTPSANPSRSASPSSQNTPARTANANRPRTRPPGNRVNPTNQKPPVFSPVNTALANKGEDAAKTPAATTTPPASTYRRDPINIPNRSNNTPNTAVANRSTNEKTPTRAFRGPTPLKTDASKTLSDATKSNLADSNNSKPLVATTPSAEDAVKSKIVDPVATPPASNVARRPTAPTPIRKTPVATTPTVMEEMKPVGVVTNSNDATWPQKHTIASGDTLSEISMKYYDTSREVDRIVKANPDASNPRNLKVGVVLVIPAPDATIEAPAASTKTVARKTPTRRDTKAPATKRKTEKRNYTVRSGDTFYSIARDLYGDSGRWKELYKANKSLVRNKATNLKPGMVLRLPA